MLHVVLFSCNLNLINGIYLNGGENLDLRHSFVVVCKQIDKSQIFFHINSDKAENILFVVYFFTCLGYFLLFFLNLSHPIQQFISDFVGIKPDFFVFLHDFDIGLDGAEKLSSKKIDVVVLKLFVFHDLLYLFDEDFVAVFVGGGFSNIFKVDSGGDKFFQRGDADHNLIAFAQN